MTGDMNTETSYESNNSDENEYYATETGSILPNKYTGYPPYEEPN